MQLILRAAAAYWILLFAVRLIGRRTASQMAPFDLVVLFLFAGVTITAVLDDDHSMAGAISVLCTIGLSHILASWLKMHSDWFGRIVDGTPLVLLEKGKWHVNTMKRMRIQDDDIMSMARDQGLMSLDEIDYDILERNGEISIIPAEKSSE